MALRTADRDFMASLARGLSVILAFSAEGPRMTAAQLGVKTGLSRWAVRRCLLTLTRLRYVASDDGRSFFLLPGLLAIADAYASSSPLVLAAQPFLDRVSDAVGESCSLATPEGDDIVYVARSVGSRIISTRLNPGSRWPAYCTSSGLVFLANRPERDLDAYAARVKLIPYTERTLSSRLRLRDVLKTIRKDDYAVADRTTRLPIRSIAVPVRSAAGEVFAGIDVIVRAGRVSRQEMKSLYLPHLRAAARDIGALLPPS